MTPRQNTAQSNKKMIKAFETRWKIWNEVRRWLILPYVKLIFVMNDIPWGKDWQFYGVPIIQRHRRSMMQFGPHLSLRSSVRTNPLGPTHPVILCTWQERALLEIGAHFGMTGGSIVAAERITIGEHVAVGANTTIIDTDFHPLDSQERRSHPQKANTAPVIIEDDVFIGMNSLILKGVRIGQGSIVGAGSVVTKDVPDGVIVAGNPARVIGNVKQAVMKNETC
jgi:acetyltransferase-like isoleucine patch superfamily enzyme